MRLPFSLQLLPHDQPSHIWGTNEYGQDVFSRLMVGTRLSLTCALTATIIGTAIGVVLGLIAEIGRAHV